MIDNFYGLPFSFKPDFSGAGLTFPPRKAQLLAMRKRRGLKKLGDSIAPASFWILSGVGALTVGFSKAEKSTEIGFMITLYNQAVALGHDHYGWVVPTVAGCLAGVAQLLKNKGAGRIDGVVKKLLNQFRDTSFPKEDAYVTHRVTLFKHCKWHFGWCCVGTFFCALFSKNQRWRWPWRGWLVAYERAGEYQLDTRACFYAPLGDVDKAEGFAGCLLRDKLALKIEDLPEITAQSNANDKERWLDASAVDVSYLQKKLALKKTLPRSFWGTYIEVDSAAWGVLVVDSRSSKLPKTIERNFAPTGACISQLLSKKTS